MPEEVKYKSSYKGARLDALLGKVDETKPEGPTSELIQNSPRLITSGGVKGAVDSKYTKPVGGIPKSDLAAGVQASLGKADLAYQKPSGGVPKEDLSSSVQTSLNKADSAIQDVSGKADKDTNAVEGNLAKFDANGNPIDSDIPVTKFDNIDSQIADIKASPNICEGLADTISAGVPQEFVFRKSGGDGVNYLKRIKGKSLAWNQAFYNGNGSDGTTGWQVHANFTLSNVGGKIRVTEGATAPSGGQNILAQTANVRKPKVVGHKYLLMFDYKVTTSQQAYRMAINFGGVNVGIVAELNSDVRYSRIITTTGAYATFLTVATFDNTLGEGGYIDFDNIMCIDLTLLYGSEIDGMTDEQIRAKYEADFGTGYHEYNEGTLISNDAEVLKTVGFNQWDEEWEKYSYNQQTGEKQGTGNALRSKNKIRVFSGTNYYAYFAGTSRGIRLFYYYSDGSYYGTTIVQGGNTFTIPNGVYYMAFQWSDTYGPTYNNDICINLSDPAKNGTYESYWKRTLNLGLNSFKVKDGQGNIITVNGLKSAGTTRDEIVGNKYIKRVGSVDMGTLTFGASSQVENGFVITGGIQDAKGYVSTFVTDVPNVLSVRYLAQNYNTLSDKGICFRQSSAFGYIIKDSAFAGYTTEQVATALSGVYLDYELATPIEYELVEPFFPAVMVDELGTERAVYPVHEDGTPSAPFNSDSNYSTSVRNVGIKVLIVKGALNGGIFTPASGQPSFDEALNAYLNGRSVSLRSSSSDNNTVSIVGYYNDPDGEGELLYGFEPFAAGEPTRWYRPE